MSTASNKAPDRESPPPENGPEPHELGARKAQHLEICLDEQEYAVETGATGLEGIGFLHQALPELNYEEIDTGIRFLGHAVRLPMFISSMTGGSEAGFRANKELARAAQTAGIPVGMGSIRILFRRPEVFDHFALKKLAPDVPVFANLGGVQTRELEHAEVFEMLRRLEVQGIAIHLNPGQELFQHDGDRDFRGVLTSLLRFVDRCPVPVIVKETGFGIDPRTVRRLVNAGVAYVDLAGGGGTNWVQVEAYRRGPRRRAAAEEFQDWGYPTGILLGAVESVPETGGRILASGGLRTGLDLAKSLALGAHAAGYALPFIRAVHTGGAEGALELVSRYEEVLRAAMLLTGSRSVADLRKARLLRSAAFRNAVSDLRRAVGFDHPQTGA